MDASTVKSIKYTLLRMVYGRAWNLVRHKKYEKACRITHEYADYYIEQALSGKGEIIKTSSLLTNLSKETDDRLYIRSQVLQGMMAAQETTSSLISNACLSLSRSPRHWEQIRSMARDPQNADLSFDSLTGLQPVRKHPARDTSPLPSLSRHGPHSGMRHDTTRRRRAESR